jgi:tRNA threonylcarbamoyladenosine biosynthesis protein TsaE
MLVLRVDDLAATHAVAGALAGLARAGDVIVLAGEMGAGKTAFAQGFGRALGITEPITSPTFTLVHSYPCSNKLTLHHADLYRLDTSGEVTDLALHELASFGGIVLVEWGDVAATTLGDHLEVRITHPDDSGARPETDETDEPDEPDEPDDEFADTGVREIEIHATGATWAGRWDRLTRAVEAYRC